MQDYIFTLQAQFPEAQIEQMQEPSGGAEFWIRVKAPDSIVEDVLDKTAELSYNWYIKYTVTILASVSGAGTVTAKV